MSLDRCGATDPSVELHARVEELYAKVRSYMFEMKSYWLICGDPGRETEACVPTKSSDECNVHSHLINVWKSAMANRCWVLLVQAFGVR